MASDELSRYLAALYGSARPRTLVEARWRVGDGMRRRFVPAGNLSAVARAVRAVGDDHDVYVGVLPRWRRAGGRADVVGDGRTVWVDLDVEDGLRVLEPVDPPPALIVASGGRGHVHAYWRLSRALAPRQIERANGRLAFALGGDLRSVDPARILRPPGTRHVGRDAEVRLLAAHDTVTSPGALTGGLPDAPGWHPTRRRRARRSAPAGLVESVAPEVYVQRLTGQTVGRSRKVTCPLHHEDCTPSLHVYPDAERGWYCFGCATGGDVFDLAGAVWGRELHGREFAALRADLHAVLIG